MAHDHSSSQVSISKLTWSFILGQSLIIIALSIWLYKEYVSNQYLQTYLAGVFEGQGSMIALLGLGGILALGFAGILLKAGNILGEIEHISSKIEENPSTVPTVEAFSQMPVLDVIDPRPMDDVSRIHGSMRRWNARSKRRDQNS